MTLSVSHNNSADSSGAISGNLWGAIHGAKCMDSSVIELVGGVDIIKELFDFPPWGINTCPPYEEFRDYIWNKYLGW
jgi:hypothetical protein